MLFNQRFYGVEKQDKGYIDATSCRVFLYKDRLPLKERYLLFKLFQVYSLGLPGQAAPGGVQRLAKDLGYSKDGVSRNLRFLVDQGLLVKGQEPTRGRPRTTYSLDMSVQKALSRPWKTAFLASWLIRILKAEEHPFSALSTSERSLLAFLWGQVINPRACVLDGQGVSRLARKAGIDSSTFYELINRLHQKGMLVPSGAAFTADGATNKTKTYFLLGPAVLSCWPKAFTWHVDMGAVLSWFVGDSKKFSGKKLLRKIENGASSISGRWGSVQDKLPELWEDSANRNYALIQCCAALSHAFSMEGANFWSANVLYSKIQSALLRVLGLPVAGADSHHLVIEERDLAKLDSEQRALFFFVEQISNLLVMELKKLFPVLLYPQDLGRGMKLLSCYPVELAGMHRMRIDLVTADDSAGDKFGAYLRAEHKRNGLVLPEQLQENPGC